MNWVGEVMLEIKLGKVIMIDDYCSQSSRMNFNENQNLFK